MKDFILVKRSLSVRANLQAVDRGAVDADSLELMLSVDISGQKLAEYASNLFSTKKRPNIKEYTDSKSCMLKAWEWFRQH